MFSPSGIVDPWVGALCVDPCLQPESAPVHRVPVTPPEVVEAEARKMGESDRSDIGSTLD